MDAHLLYEALRIISAVFPEAPACALNPVNLSLIWKSLVLQRVPNRNPIALRFQNQGFLNQVPFISPPESSKRSGTAALSRDACEPRLRASWKWHDIRSTKTTPCHAPQIPPTEERNTRIRYTAPWQSI